MSNGGSGGGLLQLLLCCCLVDLLANQRARQLERQRATRHPTRVVYVQQVGANGDAEEFKGKNDRELPLIACATCAAMVRDSEPQAI